MMHIVEKFMFCGNLEVVGLIVGCLGLSSNILLLMSLIYWAYESTNLCNGIGILNNEGCLIFISVYRVVIYVLLIANVYGIYAYKNFILGIKKKCHKMLKPILILYIVGLYSNFYILLISKEHPVIITLGLIFLFFQFYFFIVIISLNMKFRKQSSENDRVPMVHIDV
ncbi:hypothetical protein PVAND_016927 [Polypedilum vanderplanki]|uniref:Uncharacterized protein n=1 Tax=Polypedilum vanderplanki TaxID=319348 RepID=A0A9J6BGL2_POLVA|nr:hypothetical protein PVAND_016927 [Polypedilum vanderplanki]